MSQNAWTLGSLGLDQSYTDVKGPKLVHFTSNVTVTVTNAIHTDSTMHNHSQHDAT